MNALDREKAREAWHRYETGHMSTEEYLDALDACVVPAPQPTINRDALQSARRRIAVLYMAGSGGEAAALDLRLAIDELDAVLALGRPATGVVLTPEEAGLAREWFATLQNKQWETPADVALATRLEASS